MCNAAHSNFLHYIKRFIYVTWPSHVRDVTTWFSRVYYPTTVVLDSYRICNTYNSEPPAPAGRQSRWLWGVCEKKSTVRVDKSTWVTNVCAAPLESVDSWFCVTNYDTLCHELWHTFAQSLMYAQHLLSQSIHGSEVWVTHCVTNYDTHSCSHECMRSTSWVRRLMVLRCTCHEMSQPTHTQVAIYRTVCMCVIVRETYNSRHSELVCVTKYVEVCTYFVELYVSRTMTHINTVLCVANCLWVGWLISWHLHLKTMSRLTIFSTLTHET